jgi:hypothetical protein
VCTLRPLKVTLQLLGSYTFCNCLHSACAAAGQFADLPAAAPSGGAYAAAVVQQRLHDCFTDVQCQRVFALYEALCVGLFFNDALAEPHYLARAAHIVCYDSSCNVAVVVIV